MKKPLNDAPKRLQRMLLQLQKYSLQIWYKKGKYMYLADALSRAYLPETEQVAEVQELEQTSHTESLAMAPEDVQRLKDAASHDEAMQVLCRTIQQGWPQHRAEVPDVARPYFDFRDQMTTQDQLVFKGAAVVIPAALRYEMMVKCHATHIGIEGGLRRARESMYWPRMSADMKDYISRCDVCLSHQNAQPKETLLQHEIIARPWAKIGADLCDFRGRTLLVVVDYFSGYIEVERLQSTTTTAVSKALKALFARYGVPQVLMTDNGPQFASAEFAGFAAQWGFQHLTSSPHYPQSNGRVENAVKTVKRLFTKCHETRQSEFQALLDWRNTPTEGLGSSPAQRFLGRRCRTLLPMSETLLQPAYDTSTDEHALKGKRAKQAHYYNCQSRDLPPLHEGEAVRLQLPGQKQWSLGICTGSEGPRSYRVQVDGTEYRRNRRQLIRRDESPPVGSDEQPQIGSSEQGPSEAQDLVSSSALPMEQAQPPSPLPESPANVHPRQMNADSEPQGLRRSTRQRRAPDWITTYV